MDYYRPIPELDTVKKTKDKLKKELAVVPKNDILGNGYNRDWDNLYRIGLDGIIVNLGYRIVKEGTVKYSTWKNKMESHLRLLMDYGVNERALAEIPQIVWLVYFEEKEKPHSHIFKESEFKSFGEFAHTQEGIARRLLNNKVANIISILLLALYPFIVKMGDLSVYVMGINSIIFIAMLVGKKKYFLIPIVCSGAAIFIAAIGAAFYDQEVSRLVTFALISLILVIPFYCNAERAYEPTRNK